MKRNFNSGVDSQHGSVESDSRVPFLLILGGVTVEDLESSFQIWVFMIFIICLF